MNETIETLNRLKTKIAFLKENSDNEIVKKLNSVEAIQLVLENIKQQIDFEIMNLKK